MNIIDLKYGTTLYQSQSLKRFKVIGVKTIIPLGLLSESKFVILQEMGMKNFIEVSAYLCLNSTREWATTKDMAISNSIKLLENQIVQFTTLRG